MHVLFTPTNILIIAGLAVVVFGLDWLLVRAQKARERQEADPAGHAVEEFDKERRAK